MADVDAMIRVTPLRATMSPAIQGDGDPQQCAAGCFLVAHLHTEHTHAQCKYIRIAEAAAGIHHIQQHTNTASPEILKRISSGLGGALSFEFDFSNVGAGGGGWSARRNESSDAQGSEYLQRAREPKSCCNCEIKLLQ
jgi:hypothetical protein